MNSSHQSTVLVLLILTLVFFAILSSAGCGGIVEPLPPLAVTPDSVSLSGAPGSVVSQTVNVTNIGSTPLQISQARITGTGFTLAGITAPVTLAPKQRVTLQVRFVVTAGANTEGSLTIATDALHRPFRVPLHGRGGENPPSVNPSPSDPSVSSVTISPTTASLSAGGTIQFVATVNGTVTNTNLTWSASAGSITQTGFYTAPGNAGKVTVTVASNVDPSVSAGAVLIVTAAPPANPPSPPSTPTPTVTSVTVSPTTASSITGGTLPFAASVQGTASDKSVTWSASAGSITQAGLYTAPANPGKATVTATSNADPSLSASALVTVTAAPSNPPPSAPPTSAGACPTTITPTGGTDNSNWLSKMQAAVSAGACVEITAGSYTISANFTPPDNAQIVCDDNVVVGDTSGYGSSDVMLAFEGISGVTFTGTGSGANECELTMPNGYASNINNSDQGSNQYKHALEVSGGSDNIAITGIHIKNAGGDGLYIADATNVTITNVLSEANIRNGGSATDSFSGLLIQNSTFQNNVNANAGICVGFDDEPNNSSGPNGLTFTGNTMTGNDCSQIPGGLRLSLEDLNSRTPGVNIVVNNNTATNNGGADYKEILPSGGLSSSASVTGSGNIGSNGAVSLPFPE